MSVRRAVDRACERNDSVCRRIAQIDTRFAQTYRIKIMAIPLNYNLRNLIVRKTTTLMTAAGIALTVAVLVGDLALVEGLSTAFKKTGHPLQALVLRKGGSAEIGRVVSRRALETMKENSGIVANRARER